MRCPICNEDKPRRLWSNSQWNNSSPVVTDNNGWRRNCCADCTHEIGFYYRAHPDPPQEPTVKATVRGPQEPSSESHPGLQELLLQLMARVEELERRIRTIEVTPTQVTFYAAATTEHPHQHTPASTSSGSWVQVADERQP